MAPEAFTNDGSDQNGDLYALGVIAYELLTGHAPFRGNPTAVSYAQVNTPPPAPPPAPARPAAGGGDSPAAPACQEPGRALPERPQLRGCAGPRRRLIGTRRTCQPATRRAPRRGRRSARASNAAPPRATRFRRRHGRNPRTGTVFHETGAAGPSRPRAERRSPRCIRADRAGDCGRRDGAGLAAHDWRTGRGPGHRPRLRLPAATSPPPPPNRARRREANRCSAGRAIAAPPRSPPRRRGSHLPRRSATTAPPTPPAPTPRRTGSRYRRPAVPASAPASPPPAGSSRPSWTSASPITSAAGPTIQTHRLARQRRLPPRRAHPGQFVSVGAPGIGTVRRRRGHRPFPQARWSIGRRLRPDRAGPGARSPRWSQPERPLLRAGGRRGHPVRHLAPRHRSLGRHHPRSPRPLPSARPQRRMS